VAGVRSGLLARALCSDITPADRAPAVGFNQGLYLSKDLVGKTGDVGATADEDDSGHAEAADIGGEGEEGVVD
jgi:hypothetical protein